MNKLSSLDQDSKGKTIELIQNSCLVNISIK